MKVTIIFYVKDRNELSVRLQALANLSLNAPPLRVSDGNVWVGGQAFERVITEEET